MLDVFCLFTIRMFRPTGVAPKRGLYLGDRGDQM